MTDTTRTIDEIRAALEKVQHSKWFMSPWHVEEDASAVRNSNDFSFIANTSGDAFAAFIATVNPLAIRALLDHVAALKVGLKTLADEGVELRARVRELEGALGWYGEQARLARLIHSEGDKGRHALADDGGKRARAVLTGEKQS